MDHGLETWEQPFNVVALKRQSINVKIEEVRSVMTTTVRRRRTMVWGSTSPSTSRPSPSSATSASSPTSPRPPTSASSPTSSTPSTPASSSSPSSPPRSAVSGDAEPQLANIFADLCGGPVSPGAQSLRQVRRLDQERYSVLQFPGKMEAASWRKPILFVPGLWPHLRSLRQISILRTP